MPWCPNEGTEYRPGFTVCADCGATLVPEMPAPKPVPVEGEPSALIGGTSLGTYDRMQVPLIVDLLAQHGIDATADDARRGPYTRSWQARIAQIIVPTERAAEARRVIAEELHDVVEEVTMRAGLDPVFAGEDEPETDDRETGPLISFGWLEPEVAKVFMEVCKEEDIACEPEYPLDAPPPPYAREDGRVRIHVEEWFIDAAANLLETKVREQLRHRWIHFNEPLRGEDP